MGARRIYMAVAWKIIQRRWARDTSSEAGGRSKWKTAAMAATPQATSAVPRQCAASHEGTRVTEFSIAQMVICGLGSSKVTEVQDREELTNRTLLGPMLRRGCASVRRLVLGIKNNRVTKYRSLL